MTGAIAIFVKTPGLSASKTRLAAGIGEPAALAWYEAALLATQSVVAAFSAATNVAAYWAVAEPHALTLPRWASLPCVNQGSGGLGLRMAQVHSELVVRHGRALLIGADAPQLELAQLLAADAWLQAEASRLVLGPASDGGFWLVGGNRVLPAADWSAVSYSKRQTAEQFRRLMAPHGHWHEIGRLGDVDQADDLPNLLADLQALATPTEQQRALLQLTEALLSTAVSA